MPPFGHATHLREVFAPGLLQHDEVWVAVRTWRDVLGIEPHTSVDASNELVADLTRS